jgi:hypothetical protein
MTMNARMNRNVCLASPSPIPFNRLSPRLYGFIGQEGQEWAVDDMDSVIDSSNSPVGPQNAVANNKMTIRQITVGIVSVGGFVFILLLCMEHSEPI